MKIGPIDFTQPSTWRGAIGFIGIFGLVISPELKDQIAIAIGAALSAVEIFRDEYKRRQLPPLPPIELQGEAAADAYFNTDSGLQKPVQPEPPSTRHLPNPPGFGDR